MNAELIDYTELLKSLSTLNRIMCTSRRGSKSLVHDFKLVDADPPSNG